jgi:hypothetical protein
MKIPDTDYTWRHGVDCQKALHSGRGYLHMANDDTPYSVDGVWYCGRCHIFLSTMSHEVPEVCPECYGVNAHGSGCGSVKA